MTSHCDQCDRPMHPADAAQWYRCHKCRRGNPWLHKVRTFEVTKPREVLHGPSLSDPFEVESMDRIKR